MLMLEENNRIVTDILTRSFEKPSSLDETFVDFDSIRYHLSTPNKKSILLFSIYFINWHQLLTYDVEAVLQRHYGHYITAATEPEYSISFEINLEQLPATPEERTELIKSFSLLKRNALAAPFEQAFAIQQRLEANPPAQDAVAVKQELMILDYRPEEAIYLLPSSDRVTVVFSTIFKDETDQIFGKVFLQEFVDARRRPSCQTAPQVLYSNRDPPLEIREAKGLIDGGNVGYVTFVLFPRHFSTPTIAAQSITQIQLFRNYLHYHIKCSKAYMHSRMRHRVAEFLKVLNRAKPEVPSEKGAKTASGRAFVRS